MEGAVTTWRTEGEFCADTTGKPTKQLRKGPSASQNAALVGVSRVNPTGTQKSPEPESNAIATMQQIAAFTLTFTHKLSVPLMDT